MKNSARKNKMYTTYFQKVGIFFHYPTYPSPGQARPISDHSAHQVGHCDGIGLGLRVLTFLFRLLAQGMS